MSPDEIIAANLWPWPDPLLKRDRAGQVLFVNAAFLQLYGGRAQDWHGKPVSGWPAPATQGAQRFETKAGEPGQENVFDWVEMVMADGDAMAIARNVTALIAPPNPPAEDAPAMPVQPPVIQAPPEPVEAPQPPAPAPVLAPPAAPAPQPAMAAPETPSPAPAPQAPDLTSEFEDTLNRDADDYSYETQPEPAPNLEDAPQPTAETMPVPEPVEQKQEREYVRRALPIEDSTSVLGTNWRDQVIAKAVGAETADGDDGAQETQPSQNTDNTQSEEPIKTGDGLQILLAEDNAINALLTRTLLEAEGAEVDTVEDGVFAVEAVKAKQYDLIFMDMRMPNMDGLEATRKIRSYGYTKPIIALTANAFDDDRNACFDSGMNDFMTKPVSAEELIEMVTSWVNKNREREKLAS